MQAVNKQEMKAIIKLIEKHDTIPDSVKNLVRGQFEFFAQLYTMIESKD